MITLTQKERETILVLLKEYTTFYNANAISKVLSISHVGAQKILKRLKKENIVIDRKIGKSIVYKLKLDDVYVCQLTTFLLVDEANHFKRWKEEFKEVGTKNRIVLIFGSAIKNYAQARDIDIMIVQEKEDLQKVNDFLKNKEEILPKKIHAIKLTRKDLLENLKKRDKVIIDIVKNAIVLYGQDKYVEILEHVTNF